MRTKLVSGLKQELLVTVQAVRKNYPSTGTYLIIHPYKWPVGRADLGSWLQASVAAVGVAGGGQALASNGKPAVKVGERVSGVA